MRSASSCGKWKRRIDEGKSQEAIAAADLASMNSRGSIKTPSRISMRSWFVEAADSVVQRGLTFRAAKVWAAANSGRFDVPLQVKRLGSPVVWQRVAGRWRRVDSGAPVKPPPAHLPYRDD